MREVEVPVACHPSAVDQAKDKDERYGDDDQQGKDKEMSERAPHLSHFPSNAISCPLMSNFLLCWKVWSTCLNDLSFG